MAQNSTSEYQIAQLIFKSVAKIITPEEQKTLDAWLSIEENSALYNKIIDKNTIQNKLAIYRQIETERIYKKLESKLLKHNKKAKKLKFFKVFKFIKIRFINIYLRFFDEN